MAQPVDMCWGGDVVVTFTTVIILKTMKKYFHNLCVNYMLLEASPLDRIYLESKMIYEVWNDLDRIEDRVM